MKIKNYITAITLGLVLLFGLSSCKAKQQELSQKEIPVVNSSAFQLLSDDFKDNDYIPKDFTCDGKNISPSLKWINSPKNTKSFILTVIDPDAPSGNFRHWIVVNIPANINSIAKNSKFPFPSKELTNDFGNNAWGGPCPPSGTHRYIFTLYAVDVESYDGDIQQLDDFLKKHTIKSTVLTGLYKRGLF